MTLPLNLDRIRILRGPSRKWVTKTSRSSSSRTSPIQQLTDSAPLSSRAKSRDLCPVELKIVRDSSTTLGVTGKQIASASRSMSRKSKTERERYR
jgi:hypothetical protein